MAALTALTGINDGEIAPIAHTFTPLGPDKDGVQWFEQSVPAPANGLAAKRFSITVKRATPGNQLNGVTRITGRFWYPVMETLATSDSGITPPPTISYQLYAEIRYVLPERSNEQERKNLKVLVSNLQGSTTIADTYLKLQPLY